MERTAFVLCYGIAFFALLFYLLFALGNRLDRFSIYRRGSGFHGSDGFKLHESDMGIPGREAFAWWPVYVDCYIDRQYSKRWVWLHFYWKRQPKHSGS